MTHGNNKETPATSHRSNLAANVGASPVKNTPNSNYRFTALQTSVSGRTQGPRWSREQIRAARLVALVPLLEKRRLEIIAREADNFILTAYPLGFRSSTK